MNLNVWNGSRNGKRLPSRGRLRRLEHKGGKERFGLRVVHRIDVADHPSELGDHRVSRLPELLRLFIVHGAVAVRASKTSSTAVFWASNLGS